jgi:hypothetical protein
MVVKSAAKLKHLAPQTIIVADPLAFSGCGPTGRSLDTLVKAGGEPMQPLATTGRFHRTTGTRKGAGETDKVTLRRAIHPVTMWRGRLSVALDALATAAADTDRPVVERRSPVETTNVQLPTGDRLQIPTGAETLRLKSYLIMCRNTAKDFAEFADLVDSMETQTAALVLARMDRYYCGQHPRNQWVATQLVRRLADPHPSDVDDALTSGPDAEADWARVRQRCLSVAVAMLEEAR